MKKLLAMLLACVMVFGLCACSGNSAPAATQAPATEAPKAEAPAAEAPAAEAPAADGSKVTINVMSFTDEVPGMITKYMEAHPDVAAKYDVNTTIIATTVGL